MTDQVSRQQAILGAALAEGQFGPGARTALITAQAEQASDLAWFRISATREENWALTRTLASPLAAQAATVEQRAAAAGGGSLDLGAPASQQWSAGMSFTVGWMRHADQQLSAWTAARAQALQRSAMRSAVITGAAALAVLALVLLATIVMTRSMVREHREAVRLAGEEARQRRSIECHICQFLPAQPFPAGTAAAADRQPGTRRGRPGAACQPVPDRSSGHPDAAQLRQRTESSRATRHQASGPSRSPWWTCSGPQCRRSSSTTGSFWTSSWVTQ